MILKSELANHLQDIKATTYLIKGGDCKVGGAEAVSPTLRSFLLLLLLRLSSTFPSACSSCRVRDVLQLLPVVVHLQLV